MLTILMGLLIFTGSFFLMSWSFWLKNKKLDIGCRKKIDLCACINEEEDVLTQQKKKTDFPNRKS